MALGDDIKNIIEEASQRYKYARGKKGLLEPTYKKLEQWRPEGPLGKIGQVAGLRGIDVSWFLFCLMKYVAKDTKNGLKFLLLDNALINKWEKDKKNKKIKTDDSEFSKFFKKLQKSHPRVAATLHLWMVYTLMILGGVGGVKISEHNNKEADKERIIDAKNEDQELEDLLLIDENFDDAEEEKDDDKLNITANEIKDIVKYNVRSKNFVENFISENWNEIVMGVLEFETWRAKPVLQKGEKRYTYGPGLTWVYTKVKDKKANKLIIKQDACIGKFIKKAQNFSVKQIFDQVKRHCFYPTECVAVMQRQLEKYGFKEITDQQAFALFVAGYQMPAALTDNYKKRRFVSNGIIHKLKNAGSNLQKQVDAFMAGPEVPENIRVGTNKRRWWCAMLYVGKITPDDLLNMDRDAFSKMHITTIIKNGHFVYDNNTIKYALSLRKPSNGTVKSFITKHNILKGSVVRHKKSSAKIEESNDNLSMAEMNEALKAFKKKDYQTAIKHYKKSISLDENNMEAYSSLALAYKKLGDRTHNISDYEKVLDVVKQCNVIMNKNKSLLHDPDIKAATYYNAGVAREEIAKLQVQKNKIDDAIENYRKAKLNFETAYDNAKEVENSERMRVYKNAQKRVDNAVKDLKTRKKKSSVFMRASLQIKNKQRQHVNTVICPFDSEYQA